MLAGTSKSIDASTRDSPIREIDRRTLSALESAETMLTPIGEGAPSSPKRCDNRAMAGSIRVRVIDGTRLRAEVISDQGARLEAFGAFTDIAPRVEGYGPLASNRSLISNLWAFAKTAYAARTISKGEAFAISDPDEQSAALRLIKERRRALERQSAEFARVAQWIADVADDVSPLDTRIGWCSSCFAKTEHRKSNRPVGQLPVYVCQVCGSPTLPCAAPGCENMAVRSRGAVRVPQYCAEHRHAIPGFEKAQKQIGGLWDYEAYLSYDKPNLSGVTRAAVFAAAGLAAAVPVALIAAPAIGGAIGSLGGFGVLSGAAASSHGLAVLGGGSIATGGLGMAGGTAVVTAAGAAVGGTLGASITNSYIREDKSFRIELLRPGTGGVPVIVANGFLTEGDVDRWGGWRAIVDARYPDSPVYRVRWGAKELRDLGKLGAGLFGKAGGVAAAKGAAAHAAKAGARFFGRTVGPALLAADLAKNPWHVAKTRADKTGVVVGDIVARTNAEAYVLVGHSLGARVMAVAAQALGTKPDGPRLQSVHLLGAAIGAKPAGDALTAAVDQAVYNYYSLNDSILKLVYRLAQGGQVAAGFSGFAQASERLINVDVSDQVKTHFDYQGVVHLR